MNSIKKKIWQVLVVVLVNALIIALCLQSSQASSKIGSTGSEVRQIQTKLKNWGYYNGSIDGIFGTQTKNAVIYFQRKNGLVQDGIAGKKTLSAMGISSSSDNNTNSNDYNLLARLISAESRGESYTGQVAVGAVVLNRVRHSSFPNSISGVIYQKGAFSCINDGQFDMPVSDTSYKAAKDAMNGWDPTGGAIYYYNPRTAKSQWIRTRPIICTIGNHVFCS